MRPYFPADAYEVFSELAPILFSYAIIMLVVSILSLVNYILRGIAIYTMSKKRDIKNGWLGFIPIAYRYQYGALAGTIDFGKKTIKNPGVWTLLSPIIFNIIFCISYIPFVFSFVLNTIRTNGQNMPSAFVGFFIGIFIFVLVISVLQVFVYLFRYLALHKIYSQYYVGQRPVFYMIISMFVPCAEAILLFMHREKPLLEEAPLLNEAPAGETPNE